MLKKEKTNNIISKAEIQNNPNIDYQGTVFQNPSQKVFQFNQFQKIHHRNTSNIPQTAYIEDKKLIDFQYFYKKLDVQIFHLQLHELLKILSSSVLGYITQNSISAFNLNTQKVTRIVPLELVISFDYNPQLNLISGVYNIPYSNYKTFLFDLNTSKFCFRDDIYSIPNIIGKMDFIDFQGPKLFASGNALYGSLVDLEKNFSETNISSENFINNHDFDRKNQMLGLALENSKIQIIDLKSPESNNSILFKAHNGYVLGFKHMEDNLWVSGGEDYSIKVWDVRKVSEPVTAYYNCDFVPSSFQFDSSSGKLFVLEMYSNLLCLEFDNVVISRHKSQFMAECGGLAFDKSKRKVYLSVQKKYSHGQSGIAEFNINF